MKKYGAIECDPLVLHGLDKTVSSMASYSCSRKWKVCLFCTILLHRFFCGLDCQIFAFIKFFGAFFLICMSKFGVDHTVLEHLVVCRLNVLVRFINAFPF